MTKRIKDPNPKWLRALYRSKIVQDATLTRVHDPLVLAALRHGFCPGTKERDLVLVVVFNKAPWDKRRGGPR